MPERSFFLHCDSCHHEVHYRGSMTRAHIGTPCPVCQSDMLTEADFKAGRRIQRLLRVLEFFGLVKPNQPGDTVGPDETRLSVRHHQGKTRIAEKLGRL